MDWKTRPSMGIGYRYIGHRKKKFPGSPASLTPYVGGSILITRPEHCIWRIVGPEILAEVYLELIGGKQPNFVLDTSSAKQNGAERCGTTELETSV